MAIQERRDFAFLSFVGMRPAATATGLDAFLRWLESRDRSDGRALTHVGLLATDNAQIQLNASRLQAWVEARAPGVECKAVAMGDRSPAAAAVAADSWLRLLGGSHDIVFDVASGLKMPALEVARTLPASAIVLYPSDRGCWAECRQDQRCELLPIGHLGIHALLQLTGRDAWTATRGTAQSFRDAAVLLKTNIPESNRLYSLAGPDGARGFPAVYEHAGRLFVAAIQVGTDSKDPDQTAYNLDRDLQALISPGFADIECRLLVMTDRADLANRIEDRKLPQARAVELGASHSEAHARRLRVWMNGLSEDTVCGILPRFIPSPAVGESAGDGVGLVVVVGPDPSATLVSIATHQPAELVLVVDGADAKAQAAAERILSARSYGWFGENGGPGSLSIIHTDLFGRGILDPLASWCGRRTTRVDLTPGAATQGVALQRLPGIQRWSQHTAVGKAVSLDGAGEINLAGPSALLHAFVVGGVLWKNWAMRDDLRAHAAVLEPATRAITNALANGVQFGRGGFDRWFRERCAGSDCRGLQPSEWFECIVAWAALGAEPDEVVVGLSWVPSSRLPSVSPWERPSWEPLASGEVRFADENDVLLRFGSRFVALECKSFIPGAEELTKVARRHARRTANRLGRFAVKAVVVPRLPQGFTPDRRSSAVWPWEVVADPERLKAAITAAIGVTR